MKPQFLIIDDGVEYNDLDETAVRIAEKKGLVYPCKECNCYHVNTETIKEFKQFVKTKTHTNHENKPALKA